MTAWPRQSMILTADARTALAALPPRSVHAVVTSPPYFRQRDYQTAGQIGQEATVAEWVAELRAVCRLIARVLKPDGSLWLNVNDSMSARVGSGAPRKSLLLGPERLLLALAEDGWLTKGKAVWAKSNPMPESVGDRLARTWEPFYHLTRSPDAYFDLDAIRELHQGRTRAAVEPNRRYGGEHGGLARLKARGISGHVLGKNPGDCWRLPKGSGYRGQHFAVFPESLIERPIRATVPERVCLTCDRPYRRRYVPGRPGEVGTPGPLRPACGCRPRRSAAATVLDPFAGVGTVGVVAAHLGRKFIGIELNPTYAELARERLRGGGRLPGGRKSQAALVPAVPATHNHPKGGEHL